MLRCLNTCDAQLVPQAYMQVMLMTPERLPTVNGIILLSHRLCISTESSAVSPPPAAVTTSHHAGGRYLNDVWLLNLDTLTWQLVTTSAKPLPPIGGGRFDEIEPIVTEPLLGNSNDSKPGSTTALPPSAGHILVAWGSSLLCIGGHTKAGTYSHYRKVLTS